jgi:hypothetical protein
LANIQHGRWRIAVLGLLAAVTILAIRGAPASSAATTAEGPLSPVETGYHTKWDRANYKSGWELYTGVGEPSCSTSDTSNLYSSTAGERFSVRLALDPSNNGKRISRVDVVLCYKTGATAGASFAPFVGIDGIDHDGQPLTATNSNCGEISQTVVLPTPPMKTGETVVEVGAVKSGADTKTVRICSIRATVYYESDDPPPPPPPLPTVDKAAATPSLVADQAHWDITIDNSAANAVGRDGIAITDGFADAVLESVTPVGACAGASGALSPWTCDVAAGGTTVLRVSRPRSALANACSGGTLANYVDAAALSDGTPLQITTGDSASPIEIPVPPDLSACPLPTVRLVAHDPPVAGGYASWDIVIDQPPANAIARTVTLSLAHEAEIDGQQPQDSCAPDSGAITCQVPADGDVGLTVRRAVTEENLAAGSLCNGGIVAEYLAGATLSDGTALNITTGDVASPVSYGVQDTLACAAPSISKTLLPANAATVTDPAAVAWQLTVTNPPGGLDGATAWIRDADMAMVAGPTYSAGGDYCTGDVSSAEGAECDLPAGVSVSWTVAPTVGIERTCDTQPFENTAHYRLDSSGEWIALPGPGIELEGDNALCTRTIQVCLVVEDNADGASEPDGGEFRFGNSGNSETLLLDAVEGGSACGDMVVTAEPVSVFQYAAETGDRPGSNGLSGAWSGDATGFPKGFEGAAACESAAQTETVPLAESDNSATFCNRPLPRTKTITIVRHYFPPTTPVVRPVLTFSSPTVLPECSVTDSPDGGTTSWACLVPADWPGTVQQGAQDGWADGPCPGDLDVEPGAYSRSCTYRMGTVTVIATFLEHGVPLADQDIPLVTVDGLSIAPNEPATTAPTSWGPLSANPLLTHDIALLSDPARWQLSGVPELTGEGCNWDAEPSPGASTAAVEVPPGGDCVVAFSLERLVATVVVHQLYLNAPGDAPEVSIAVDGAPNATSWHTGGTPADRWEKTVGVAGAGSSVELTSAIPAGWARVAAFEGGCETFDGPVAPLPGGTATVTIEGVGPGDIVEVCFVSVAVGSVVLVVNETHATDGPEWWNFTTTSPALGAPALVTAANPLPGAGPATDQQSFALVPAGGYAINQAGGRTACLPGATALDFETRAAAKTGSPPTDDETSGVVGAGDLEFAVLKGQTTYIRFDNAGCGTVLETGVIAIEVVNDLDGDGVRDPDEEGVAGWPITVSGPDGDGNLVTDTQGMAHYTVVTGGTYLVRQGTVTGWLATALVELRVTAGLGETGHVTFFNQPRVAVSASMSEISLENPGAAPGDGWSFSLTGCGETRTLETQATGEVTFSGLPPAAGCEYTVAVAERPGWATIMPSKTASPTGPGQVSQLVFIGVRVDVCPDCALPPAVTGGEATPSVPVLAVLPGANLVAWPGGPAPVEEVFGNADGVVAVYLWDEAAGAWLKYFPGLPGYLSDLAMLEPGAAYWVIASNRSNIPVPGPD